MIAFLNFKENGIEMVPPADNAFGNDAHGHAQCFRQTYKTKRRRTSLIWKNRKKKFEFFAKCQLASGLSAFHFFVLHEETLPVILTYICISHLRC